MAKGSDNKFPKVIITEGSAPSNADSGDQKLYIDSADHKLKRKDSSGTVVSIEDAGSGAPSTSEYVTTAADGGLSAEVVIPGLAGSADVAGLAGGGISEEYDSSTTGLTWDSTPTVNSDTTRKSYLYISHTASGVQHFIGTRAWVPGSGAFDARVQMHNFGSTTEGNTGAGLYISNADKSLAVMLWYYRAAAGSGQWTCQPFTYASSTFTTRGSAETVIAARTTSIPIYLRIARDGSNNISWYWSLDGFAWASLGTYSFTLTVALIGYRISGNNSTTICMSDWLRTNV